MRTSLIDKAAHASRADLELLQAQSSLLITHAQCSDRANETTTLRSDQQEPFKAGIVPWRGSTRTNDKTEVELLVAIQVAWSTRGQASTFRNTEYGSRS
ncbi:unnamed protein product [Anisakis simplex]|uniref:Uncharacterized protein n=1 Tax=Anisakis simplex TaxID=6269 RepID=A0A3P6Q6C3_ANISI|nr:unnamed protein product [Anisakis simplex]